MYGLKPVPFTGSGFFRSLFTRSSKTERGHCFKQKLSAWAQCIPRSTHISKHRRQMHADSYIELWGTPRSGGLRLSQNA